MMFAILLFIAAIGISAVAAYFSIVGLVSIFTASPIAIAIMGGSLELGKLVTASFLYRYWHSIHITLRVYYRDWETDRKSTRLNSSHRL